MLVDAPEKSVRDTKKHVKRIAAIMSLLATAKANGHCPHAWLTDVLTRLPTTLDKDIGALLPHRWRSAASR